MKGTKELILETGVRMFNEKGYDNVTVKDICKECGVTTGSFYHHFKSKYELLIGNRTQSIHELLLETMMMNDPVEQARTILAGYMKGIQNSGPEMQKHMLLGNLQNGCTIFSPDLEFGMTNQEREDVLELQIKLVEHCQDLGRMSTRASARELIQTYRAACFAVMLHWSCSGKDYDLTEWGDKYFDIIFQPKYEEA